MMLDLSPLTQAELNRRTDDALITAGHFMVASLNTEVARSAIKLGQEAARGARRLIDASLARNPEKERP